MNTFKDRLHAQQERNLAQYDNWLPRWRNRRVRRATAVAWLVSASAMVVTSLFAGAPSLVFTVWIALLGITTLLQTVHKVLTNNMGERSARLLDERELALRGRYSYVGFLVAVWSMLVAALVLSLTPIRDLQYGPFVLLMSLMSLASNTPTALLCWQLPDDEPDPIAEGDNRG
jgi:hypothetical protein